MKEKQTKITWDKEKDELWTYFGKCPCGATCVIAGTKYCNQCGREIINPLRSED